MRLHRTGLPIEGLARVRPLEDGRRGESGLATCCPSRIKLVYRGESWLEGGTRRANRTRNRRLGQLSPERARRSRERGAEAGTTWFLIELLVQVCDVLAIGLQAFLGVHQLGLKGTVQRFELV